VADEKNNLGIYIVKGTPGFNGLTYPKYMWLSLLETKNTISKFTVFVLSLCSSSGR
jgi:hypothetical protein